MAADDEASDAASNGRGRPPFDDAFSAASSTTMANLKALGEVQRRGLEAANQVIGRLVEQTDRSGPLFGAEAASSDARSSDPFQQFTDMMRSAFEAMFSAVSNTATPTKGSAAGVADGISIDPLVVAPVIAGETASGEFWLHNRSGADVADVRLHCGDLRTHDGWAIPSQQVTFTPPEMAEFPDRTSRGIAIDIAVGAETQPGTYRGTLLASNLPAVWLALELTVLAPK